MPIRQKEESVLSKNRKDYQPIRQKKLYPLSVKLSMRIKRGFVTHRKHKKLLRSVKGYRMTKHRLVKVAREAQLHAGQYAYAGRRKKKSNFRRLWISRISQAVKQAGISYSKFIFNLKKANIKLDRKIIANLLIDDLDTFKALIDKVRNI